MIVEVDGQRFEVPDDASHAEIDALSKPAAPAPSRPGLLDRAWSAFSGAAHGIAGGDSPGPIAGLIRSSLLHPGEWEEFQGLNAAEKAKAPTANTVGDFLGSLYTPEASMASPILGTALGVGSAALRGKAAAKAGEAVGEMAAKKAGEAAAEVRSATSALGGEVQNANRQVENIIRLLDEESTGALDPAKRAALEALRKTPDYTTALGRLADRAIEQVPGAAGRVSAREAELAALQAGVPAKVADETAAAVSGRAAWDQVKARVLRYGLPAVGGYLGHELAGDDGLAGLGVGALAGAGMRPMLHSLIRMRNSPAVRNVLWSGVEKVAGLGTTAGGRVAGNTAGRAVTALSPGVAEFGGPALVGAAATSGSEEQAAPAPGSPNASGQSPSITGAGEDPAEHFKRWMSDRGYREGQP